MFKTLFLSTLCLSFSFAANSLDKMLHRLEKRALETNGVFTEINDGSALVATVKYKPQGVKGGVCPKTNYQAAFERIEKKNYNNSTDSEQFFDQLQEMQSDPAVKNFLISFINYCMDFIKKPLIEALNDKMTISVEAINEVSKYFAKVKEEELMKYYNCYQEKNENIEKYLNFIEKNKYKNDYEQDLISLGQELDYEKSCLSTEKIHKVLLSQNLETQSNEDLVNLNREKVSEYNETKFFKWGQTKQNSIIKTLSENKVFREKMLEINIVAELKKIALYGTNWGEYRFPQEAEAYKYIVLSEDALNKESVTHLKNIREEKKKNNEEDNCFEMMEVTFLQRLMLIGKTLSAYDKNNTLLALGKEIRKVVEEGDNISLFSCFCGN